MNNVLVYLRYQLSRLARDQKGASALEYTLLLIMVALVVVGFVTPIREVVSSVWQEISDGLSTV